MKRVPSARWFCALALATCLAGCRREPDEQALRRTIAEMEVAVEQGDHRDFLDHFDAQFAGNGGDMDLRQLRATLAALSLRHEQLGVTLGPIDVKLFDDRATIRFEALATGGSWMPQTGQMLEVESHWKRVDGQWRCFAADWKERW